MPLSTRSMGAGFGSGSPLGGRAMVGGLVGPCLGMSDRRGRRQALAGEGDDEGGTLAERAPDGDRPAVGLDEVADDVQAQAQALLAVAARGAFEAGEDAVEVLGCDADAAV